MMRACLAGFPKYMHNFIPLIIALQKTLANPADRSLVTFENWFAIVKDFLKNTTFDDDTSPVPQYVEPPAVVPSDEAPRGIGAPWVLKARTAELPIIDEEIHSVSDLPVLDAASSDAAGTHKSTNIFQKMHQNQVFASLEENLQPLSAANTVDADNIGPRKTRLLANLESNKVITRIPHIVKKTLAGRAEVVHPVPSDRHGADTLLNYLASNQPTKDLQLPALLKVDDALSRGSTSRLHKAPLKSSAPPVFASTTSSLLVPPKAAAVAPKKYPQGISAPGLTYQGYILQYRQLLLHLNL